MVKGSFTWTIKVTIFVPFKSGFNAVLWCCLLIIVKNIKGAFAKIVTVTVSVNEP